MFIVHKWNFQQNLLLVTMNKRSPILDKNEQNSFEELFAITLALGSPPEKNRK